MGKIKIVSDGTVKNTTAVDADTGEAIPGVQSVHLKVVNGEWVAELEIAKPDIDITVESLVKAAR